MIRSATLDDMDRILEIARSAYPQFDEVGARAWGQGAMSNPGFCVLLGEKTFGVTGISAPFYAPRNLRATMLFLASQERAGYEPCLLLRRMVSWAFDNGAQSYRFGSDTDANMVTFAKRLGARLDKPSWVMGA